MVTTIVCKICHRERPADTAKSGVCSTCSVARDRRRDRQTAHRVKRRCHGCKKRMPLTEYAPTGGHWSERSMWCRGCGKTVREEVQRLDEAAKDDGPDAATVAAWDRLRANREASQS